VLRRALGAPGIHSSELRRKRIPSTCDTEVVPLEETKSCAKKPRRTAAARPALAGFRDARWSFSSRSARRSFCDRGERREEREEGFVTGGTALGKPLS